MGHVPETLGRFTLGEKLGSGGFGIVYRAFDAQYRCDVALKVLHRSDGLLGFKQEFRALADLVHPNLVRLYELTADERGWYVSMELVDGVSILDHVWGRAASHRPDETAAEQATPRAPVAPTVDGTRLRRSALELAEAVAYLHAAGWLHCDLKPSNVLVEATGRVVLLDFGLAVERGAQRVAKASPATPGYMAPEQLARGEATPATDWYGFGALLHEALTGDLPGPDAVLAPRGDDLDDLRALAARLLRREPELRESGAGVLHALGARVDGPRSTPGPARLFGRERELSLLDAAYTQTREEGARLVTVTGASGMGKTALVRHFLETLRALPEPPLVLTGRSYEEESVPYKALDSLVDALGRHLAQLSPGELASVTPARAARLQRLFRAFESVPFVLSAAPPTTLDTLAQRRDAFEALRELLVRLSARTPLVLFLDDVHWADLDSTKLLASLLQAPGAPRMLVVAAHRPFGDEALRVAFAEATGPAMTSAIPLGELPHEDTLAMAHHLLGAKLLGLAGEVTAESGGHPIYVQQLAETALAGLTHASAPNLSDVILERIDALEPEARELLTVVALAGHPIDEGTALSASSLEPSTARRAASTIRRARLVVSRAAVPATTLEVTHDRLREAIVVTTPTEAARVVHERLAIELERRPGTDPELLVRHYRAAGNDPKTLTFAEAAALRAERAYAFEHAARFREIVVGLVPAGAPDRWTAVSRLAEALANAGRTAEAGDAFERAADLLATREPTRLDVVELRRRAGEHALRSGHLDVGMDRMRVVLDRVGCSMTSSRTLATAQAMGRRLRLLARGTAVREKPRVEPETRARLDALWAASTGLSMANHVIADALGVQHLLEALDAGDPSAIIRGLGYEAAFEAVLGGPVFRRRCLTMLTRMDALAARTGASYDRAWARMAKGVTAYFLGDFARVWEHCDAASVIYRNECRGVAWELAICDAYRLPALAYLGDLPRLIEVVPRALEAARERGDRFAATNLRMGQQCLTLLAQDRPEEAIANAEESLRAFPSTTYLLPHYHALFARVQARLYGDDPLEAWSLVERDWDGLGRAKLLLAQFVHVEIRDLRARAAIALARRTPARAPALLRIATDEATRLARDSAAPAAALAHALRASIAAVAGRSGEVITELERARDGFARSGLRLHEHVVRERLGHWRGGTDGASEQARADAWLRANAVVRPEALARVFCPGT